MVSHLYPAPNNNTSEASTIEEEWGFLALIEHTPRTPTRENSPTRYGHKYKRAIPHSLRPRGDRVNAGTLKVRQAGSWKEIIRNARRTSYKRRRIKARARGNRKRNSLNARISDNYQDSTPPYVRLEAEDLNRAFYGHRPGGSPAFDHQTSSQSLSQTELLDRELSSLKYSLTSASRN